MADGVLSFLSHPTSLTEHARALPPELHRMHDKRPDSYYGIQT